jgi:hypothetical protein
MNKNSAIRLPPRRQERQENPARHSMAAVFGSHLGALGVLAAKLVF